MAKSVTDRWQEGNPYERYVGRWSRRVAPAFLEWLAAPSGLAWLDVGCGTGALCAAILERCSPARVIGVEPSAGFLQSARESLGARVELHEGSATAIPLADGSVDAVVSGLVLNFVPDAAAGLAEMRRVASPGGTVAAYVWDYAGKMELMRRFWDAAAALDPQAASLDEGVRFPMCAPDRLAALFAAAGLGRVATSAIDIPTRFAGFDDYWEPFLGGQGPAPSYAMSLDEGRRARLRERLRAGMPVAADGTITLTARAWAVRGTRSA